MSPASNGARLHDVAIVGAGPVGLSLALGLARAGLDVIVLEQAAATAEHSRAPAIWPATQEVLADLGVIDAFARDGILVPCAELWDADRDAPLLRVPINELEGETPYPRLLILPQSETERLLLAALEESGGEVRFASEVKGLSQDSLGVDVTYETGGRARRMRARFVVGCDGAHSAVRSHLGGTLEGVTYSVKAALADVALPDADDLAFPRLTTRPRPTIAIRIRSGTWRLIFPYPADVAPDLETWIGEAVTHLFPGRSGDPVWTSEFKLHRRVSSHWVNGRIALAGDAAHLNSPVGGEGMNAGIADAAILCRALTTAVAADNPQRLVDYVANRRRAIETGVNDFTDLATRMLLFGGGRFIRPALVCIRYLLKVPSLRRRILRRLAMLEAR